MTDDIVARLRKRAHEYDEYDWHSEIELEAADEIERLRVTMDVLLADRRATLSENHDLWREIERLREAHATLGDQTWGRER